MIAMLSFGAMDKRKMDCNLEDLYQSFKQKLKTFIASRTHDDDLANDLVQETFVKLTHYCNKGGVCTYPKSFYIR